MAIFSRPGLNRGGRPWQSSLTSNPNSFRGGFRGRGNSNMRRGGRRLSSSSPKKTPEQKKEELDAELDAYMQS